MISKMFKKPNRIKVRCVYCGRDATTSDHIPPKQIFPKPRPDNLETVPACFKCNNLAGKDEDYFFATFMFSDAGISDAGKRLWKEKLHRMYEKNAGLRRKIAQNLSEKDIYTSHGLSLGKKMVIEFDESRLNNVVSKIVKGLYYVEYKEIIPSSQRFDCLFLQTQANYDSAKDYIHMLKGGSKKWTGVFEYKHNRTEEGKPGSMWLLNFYGFATFWIIAHAHDEQ